MFAPDAPGELGDLPNPDMLRRPTMRREAQSTSALEGTFEPLETVLAQDYEVGEDKSGLSESMREVLNYLDAAECGIGQIQSGHPISLPLVRELQKLLVKGTKSDNPQACCQNIEESCEDALLRVKRLVNVRQRYRSLLDEHRYSGLSVQTAMYLIGQPTVTASMLRRRFGKSPSAVQHALSRHSVRIRPEGATCISLRTSIRCLLHRSARRLTCRRH